MRSLMSAVCLAGMVLFAGSVIAQESDIALTGTYWKLMESNGMEANRAVNDREPHMILEPGQNRVHGFTGCNRFFGGYQVDGDRIGFSRMGATRMACLHGMEQEGFFLAALEQAAKWQLIGDALFLHDTEGKRVARFKARKASGVSAR